MDPVLLMMPELESSMLPPEAKVIVPRLDVKTVPVSWIAPLFVALRVPALARPVRTRMLPLLVTRTVPAEVLVRLPLA